MTQSTRQDPVPVPPVATLLKCATGIAGLDQITLGGLPAGRATIVCGGTGTGKTLLGLEFLFKGATQYGEPGVFVAFEESATELTQNVASLGFDLPALIAGKKLLIDHVQFDSAAIAVAGTYNLDGLFIRLSHAIDVIGAKRLVLDSIDTLFSSLPDLNVVRQELRRLFNWFKSRGVTVLVTAERGEAAFTRRGLEEYVSDCVLLLDQRVVAQAATRRLRVVKYRGSAHQTDEYPFLIDDKGFTLLPITAVGLNYQVSTERLSTGVAKLDDMLEGKGYYRGSTLLISGAPGTGKTSLAAHFVDVACKRGERALFVCFEESPDQLMRNMRSIGIDLRPWVDQGLLRVEAVRPSSCGLEAHLALTQRWSEEFQPQVAVFDPISSLYSAGAFIEIKNMLERKVDYFKSRQITTLFTALTRDGARPDQTDIGISSMIDVRFQVRDLDLGGERTRLMSVLKARGMGHSKRVFEFLLTNHGVELVDAYYGPNGFLTGSARDAQVMKEQSLQLQQEQAVLRRQTEIENKRSMMEARIIAIQSEFEAEKSELERLDVDLTAQQNLVTSQRQELAQPVNALAPPGAMPAGSTQRRGKPR